MLTPFCPFQHLYRPYTRARPDVIHQTLGIISPNCTMPHFAHAHLCAPSSPFQCQSTPESDFPLSHSIKQYSTSQLYLALVDLDDHDNGTASASFSSASSESNSSKYTFWRPCITCLPRLSASSGSQSSFVSLCSTSSSRHLHSGSERTKQAIRKVRR